MTEKSKSSNIKNKSRKHLFTNSWRLGKTTTIRIQIVIKDTLMTIAKAMDNAILSVIDGKAIIKTLRDRNYKQVHEVGLSEVSEILRELADNLDIRGNLEPEVKRNVYSHYRYSVAAECCREYLKLKGIQLKDAKKYRQKTIKRELSEMVLWLESKSKENQEEVS